MKKIILTIVLLVCLFSVSSLLAATIIVPDDYPEIPDAANAAQPGDTILVRAGTYNYYLPYGGTSINLKEDVDLIGEGRDVTNIHVGAYGYYGATAISAQGNNLISGLCVGAKSIAINSNVPDKTVTIKNCKLSAGAPPYGGLACAVNASAVYFDNNICTAVSLSSTEKLRITHNIFSNIFSLSQSSQSLIKGKGIVRNNVFYSDSDETMHPSYTLTLDPIQRCIFINNIIWNAQESNPPYSYPADLKIIHTTEGDNATLLVDYCDIVTDRIRNVAEDLELIQGEHVINCDPLFVDLINFELQQGSPCINSGDPQWLDLDGSISDMGAYGGYRFAIPIQQQIQQQEKQKAQTRKIEAK